MKLIDIEILAGLEKGMWPRENKTVGVYLKINNLHIELRRRREYEKPDAYQEVSNHGWQQQRGGLYDEFFYGLTKNWCLTGTRHKMTYAQAVGFQPSLDWVIDEFDSSFNDLAIASLKYHMDWSVCYCDEDQRERYQTMIDRLSEPSPKPTRDEIDAHKERIHQARKDFLEILPELWS